MVCFLVSSHKKLCSLVWRTVCKSSQPMRDQIRWLTKSLEPCWPRESTVPTIYVKKAKLISCDCSFFGCKVFTAVEGDKRYGSFVKIWGIMTLWDFLPPMFLNSFVYIRNFTAMGVKLYEVFWSLSLQFFLFSSSLLPKKCSHCTICLVHCFIFWGLF